MKVPKKGREAFLRYYQNIYGDRWNDLLNALEEKTQSCGRFLGCEEDLANLINSYQLVPCNLFPGFYLRKDRQTIELPAKLKHLFYFMDPASSLPPKYLPLDDGDQVGDLCAAPGGKSLILIERLAKGSQLVLNDLSKARLSRLKSVIDLHVFDREREKVQFFQKDVSRWCLREREIFDKILLDVPCSSERHLLHDSKLLKQWGPGRTKNLSMRQYSILSSAWLLLKKGGSLVYSTCSISPLENDHVIQKLVKKKGAKVIDLELDEGFEKTLYGINIFPDKVGFGPIFFALLRKTVD